MAGFSERAIDFGTISTLFRYALMSLAGVLPVLLVGGTILLWTKVIATPGDIAIRIA